MMVAPAYQANRLADLLGVYKIQASELEIAQLGALYVTNAPFSKGSPCCAWDSSEIRIPSSHAPETLREAVLIDIGGTQTKVGHQGTGGEIRSVLDQPNTWFKSRASKQHDLPLESFLSALVAEIQRTLPRITPHCSIGLIWSNQVQCVPVRTGNTAGVSGIVRGRKTGGYRKGEWFLDGLRDGDDVGAIFLRTLNHAGWTPEVFLLGNDTIFTLFATPGATAGVVMSSGGNCTAIGDEGREKGHIINTELGGHLKIPQHLLSDGDIFCAESRGISSLSLEELCAGTWFPNLVYSHVCAAAKLREGSPLLQLRDDLLSGEITLTNRMLVASLGASPNANVPASIAKAGQSWTDLLTALVSRAGTLAGLLAHLSVHGQLQAPFQPVVVSLDSSMARHFPGYLEAITASFKARCESHSAELKLVRPLEDAGAGDISVPMQGMARALNTFSTMQLD